MSYIYVFLFYPLITMNWVLYSDFQKFARPVFGTYEVKKHPKGELTRLIFFKALYYLLFIAIPMITITSLAWYWIIMGFVIMHMVEGLTISIIFQLAHIVEGLEFPEPNEDGEMEENWAVHQLITTANFARKSRVASFLCGGLNFQIEHHLFPQVCHIHYRKISEIVYDTVKEYGLAYNENKTFMGAVFSHIRMMKQLGTA